MDNKIKVYFSVAGIIALLAFAYSAVAFVLNYSKTIDPASIRSFSVSAEGKATEIPDTAEFNFSVITEGGKDIGALQKENTEKTNKAIDFLKSNNINEKDIKTQNYSLTPRYQYSACTSGVCPPPQITGYTITQTVLVKIHDFKKIGDILSGVAENGVNSISQLSFKIDDPSEVQNKARKEAISKAKDKANNIASSGGFTIGRLISIEEGVNFPPPIYRGVGMGGESAVPLMMKTPNIEAGSEEITVNVTLRYEIK